MFGHAFSVRDLALAAWGVHWLKQHSEISGMASTLGGYAAKSLLHQLPDARRELIEGALKRVGIDVEASNALQLGEQALELAVPALVDEYLHNGPAAFMGGSAAAHIIQRLLDQIKAIAGMPDQNDAGHRKFAALFRERSRRSIGAEEIKAMAVKAYGAGAHWVALALPVMQETTGNFMHAELEVMVDFLRKQYAYWRKWAQNFQKRVSYELDDDLHRFVGILKDGWVHKPAPAAPTTGLFVAPCAPASAHPTIKPV